MSDREGKQTAATTRPGLTSLAWNWLDERFDLSPLVEFTQHKMVPLGGHSTIWYYFGGVTLFFFLVQIVTGILLLMYYQPGEATSYESMKYIVGRVPFGWLIRSVHCWSAHFMCIALLVHMFSVFFTKAYRKPREVTWLTGFGLLGLALTFGFSGYLLPWNELSFFATSVGTDSVKSIPVIGEWMLNVMRGGPEVTIKTLYRFFALHVILLPLATFGLIGLHTILIQRQGMAEPMPHGADDRPVLKSGMLFFPNFVMRDLLLWVLLTNLLALVSVLLPYGPGIPGMEWSLGSKADPLMPAYPGIKPEWYFLWVYQLLKEFPAHFMGMEGPQACMLLTSVLLGIWFAIPFLDRRAASGKVSPAYTDFGVGVIYFLAFLTLKAWDVGSHVPHGQDPTANPVMAAAIARTAAMIVIGVGAIIGVLRATLRKTRYFWISSLTLIQAGLHGFAGISYLSASGISLILLAVVLVVTFKKGEGTQ